MKPILVLQTGRLTEVQHAVRDHFQKGESMISILLVLLVIGPHDHFSPGGHAKFNPFLSAPKILSRSL